MGDARQSRKSTKTSSRRSESMAKIDAQQIARAVLCGLAVTCLVVMYISADGAQESVLEIVKGKDAGTSVDSTDVLKAGQIYTETPSGRMRLMDYFNNVERKISEELANRRADVASVRAQMARDFAFNAAARSKLKRNMLHKMAVNAKTCRVHLAACHLCVGCRDQRSHQQDEQARCCQLCPDQGERQEGPEGPREDHASLGLQGEQLQALLQERAEQAPRSVPCSG